MGLYGDNLFTTSTYTIDEAAFIESAVDCNIYSVQEAKFSFLPKFKNPELKEYNSVAEEAEELLNKNGTPSKNEVQKACKAACRILDIYYNAESVISLALCVTIIGIPVHLMMRCYVWAAQTGTEIFVRAESKKIIEKLKEIEEKEKDPKKKAKIKELREKVNDGAEKVKK